MEYQSNLLIDPAAIKDLLARARRVAVLGIRPERQSYKPAHYVPAALAEMGLEIIPVPVLDRDVSAILGQQVYHRVADVPGPIDIVDVFRRPDDLPAHLDDILAAKPYAVWLQSGIRHDAFAADLAGAGIKVVQSRCLMVDYRGFLSNP
jgi:predicted CoA-binding protein